MATNIENKPYLEKPVPQETTKEQMIYGGGETLREIEETKAKKKQQILNEG
jgi:hypothetical protein